MKLGLTVHTHDGKKRTAVVQFADCVKYEEVHNISMSKVEEDMKIRDLAWLAWHCEKRNKLHSLDFDSWLETIENISIGNESENVILPLESTQSIG
jgi:hypothetical protein